MAHPPSDDRSPLAIAAAWSATIMTICLEMVVPIGLGYLVDSWLGTRVVFVIVGALAGMMLGGWHLWQVVTKSNLVQPAHKPVKPRDKP